MKEIDKIEEKYGKRGGWTLPEGYFETFYREMEDKLPAYPEKPKPADLSIWQRVKPYVYLAAMFAGIWLMMRMFHNVSSPDALSLDNPPEYLAQAISHPEVGDDAVYTLYTLKDFETEEDVLEGYNDFEEFKEDFIATPTEE